MSSIKLGIEEYTTETGGRRAKIWVAEYEGVDPNIFVLKQSFDMLHNETSPEFSTVATPALLEEYPIGYPEKEGGCYRTDHIYVTFSTQDAYNSFIQSINRRIDKLCKNIDFLADAKSYKKEEWKYPEFIAEVLYTNNPTFINKLKITVPEEYKIFLKKNTRNLGVLFLDICTKEDMEVYPISSSEEMFRDNTVELVASKAVITLLKDSFKKLL